MGHVVSKQFLLKPGVIDSAGEFTAGVDAPQNVREGEVLIKGVGGAADVLVRREIQFQPTIRGGDLSYVSITLMKKDGTAVTNIEIEIFSTHDLTVTQGKDTQLHLFRDPTLSPAGTAPVKLVTAPISDFSFIIKGNKGKGSIAIKHTGGDATTDYDYLLEVNGLQLEV